jgi:hypothetical protein
VHGMQADAFVDPAAHQPLALRVLRRHSEDTRDKETRHSWIHPELVIMWIV